MNSMQQDMIEKAIESTQSAPLVEALYEQTMRAAADEEDRRRRYGTRGFHALLAASCYVIFFGNQILRAPLESSAANLLCAAGLCFASMGTIFSLLALRRRKYLRVGADALFHPPLFDEISKSGIEEGAVEWKRSFIPYQWKIIERMREVNTVKSKHFESAVVYLGVAIVCGVGSIVARLLPLKG